MADPTDRLRLTHWLSPAFPIGAFAYSQGLEYAISAGNIGNAADVQAWISAVLHHGSARGDAILLAHARHSDADLAALSDLALALCSSAERARETAELGRAFAQAISASTGQDHPARPYPVAVGAATARLDLSDEEVISLLLQGLAAQLTSVAVRFVPLGQSDGLRVMAALAPQITTLAAHYAGAGLADIHASTLQADLAAMRHETMDVRIYRT